MKKRNCRFYDKENQCSILNAKNCSNCKFFKDKKDIREENLQREYQRSLKDGSFKRYDIK